MNLILKILNFFKHRSLNSQKQNFFEAICILLPTYSFFCFLLMIKGQNFHKISSLNDLLIIYQLSP